MRTGITWRITTIFFVLILAVLFFVPNLANISWWPTKDKIRYGLDIQGGLYLVMGVDVPAVLRESSDRLAETIAGECKENSISLASSSRDKSNNDSLDIHLKTNSPGDSDKVRELLKKQYGTN